MGEGRAWGRPRRVSHPPDLPWDISTWMKGKAMDRMDAVEEKTAHLMRAVEDLSDMVTRQGREIDRLSRLVGLLVEREAEREAMGGEAPAANQRPPHW